MIHTSKCERAERAGGGGEEEVADGVIKISSLTGRRSARCLRRWSSRALDTLCSSMTLGPTGTLHEEGKEKQQHNVTVNAITFKMAI